MGEFTECFGMRGWDTGHMTAARKHTRSKGAIDAHVAALADALHGPRRAKADLLTEARDSLVDAAEAFEHRGFDPEAAARQAVREFGDVAQVAPGYQTELGLAQARRTVVLIIGVLAPQSIVWEHVGGWALGPWSWDPAPGYALVDSLLPWLGTTGIAGSLVAFLACGIGLRYPVAAAELIRATGVFALVVSVMSAVSGVLLTLLSSVPVARGLLLLTAIVLIPLLWVAVSARRCLIAA